MFELLLGLGFGSICGLGARLIKEGGVINPKFNLGERVLDEIESRAFETARKINLNGPGDMDIRGD